MSHQLIAWGITSSGFNEFTFERDPSAVTNVAEVSREWNVVVGYDQVIAFHSKQFNDLHCFEVKTLHSAVDCNKEKKLLIQLLSSSLKHIQCFDSSDNLFCAAVETASVGLSNGSMSHTSCIKYANIYESETWHAVPCPIDISLRVSNNIKTISCGDQHCLILTTLGKCFSFGDNNYGQLGLGVSSAAADNWSSELQPVAIPDELPVSHIAAGSFHSVFATESYQGRANEIFTCGCGAYYRLGHEHDDDCYSPTRVVGLDCLGALLPDGSSSGVASIACGLWHTIIITKDTYDIYGWGWNNFGQLGISKNLQLIDGEHQSLVMNKDDEQCVGSKRRKSSESELPKHKEEIVYPPRRLLVHLDDVLEFSDVVCGNRFSAFVCTGRDRVYIMGQLNINDSEYRFRELFPVPSRNMKTGGKRQYRENVIVPDCEKHEVSHTVSIIRSNAGAIACICKRL